MEAGFIFALIFWFGGLLSLVGMALAVYAIFEMIRIARTPYGQHYVPLVFKHRK